DLKNATAFTCPGISSCTFWRPGSQTFAVPPTSIAATRSLFGENTSRLIGPSLVSLALNSAFFLASGSHPFSVPSDQPAISRWPSGVNPTAVAFTVPVSLLRNPQWLDVPASTFRVLDSPVLMLTSQIFTSPSFPAVATYRPLLS